MANSSVELNTAAAGKASAEADLARAQAETERARPGNVVADTALKGGQNTLAVSSAGAANQSVVESQARISEIGQKITTMGVQMDEMRSIMKNLDSQNALNSHHMSLMDVQGAAAKAGIKLDLAKALEISSLLPKLIDNYAQMTRHEGFKADVLGPQTGAYAQIKPWVSLLGDVLGGAGAAAAGGFFGARGAGAAPGRVSNSNSVRSTAPAGNSGSNYLNMGGY